MLRTIRTALIAEEGLMVRARHGKLTDEFVGALAPGEAGRERIVRDGKVPGLLVRVGPRKRTFELRIEKPPKGNSAPWSLAQRICC